MTWHDDLRMPGALAPLTYLLSPYNAFLSDFPTDEQRVVLGCAVKWWYVYGGGQEMVAYSVTQ